MVDHQYFAHEGRDGSQPAERIRASGYLSGGGAWRIGENLAWGTGDLATPRSIMAAWMDSPGHRANILQPAVPRDRLRRHRRQPDLRSDGSGATYVTEFGVVAAPRAPRSPSRQQRRPRRRQEAREEALAPPAASKARMRRPPRPHRARPAPPPRTAASWAASPA